MRLLLVEDESDLGNLVASGLRREGYAVDLAGDGASAIAMAETNAYDLVILDLGLPDMDGLSLVPCIRAGHPSAAILILTARRRAEERVLGLDVGADDYLCKPFFFRELLARVRALLRRYSDAREPVLRFADLVLDPAARLAWQGERLLNLRRKEFALLEYFMRRPGEVISQEQLLEHVWDAEANPFTNTVRVHINALREKLGGGERTRRYIETVTGDGYRLSIDDERDGDREHE